MIMSASIANRKISHKRTSNQKPSRRRSIIDGRNSGAGCEIRCKVITDSEAVRPPIPTEVRHPFRLKPVRAQNLIRLDLVTESPTVGRAGRTIIILVEALGLPFKSKSCLAAENAALRQQVNVLQRKIRGLQEFTDLERLLFGQLYRWFPSVLNAIKIIRPDTLVRWHRASFRRYWRWKSRNLGGRSRIDACVP